MKVQNKKILYSIGLLAGIGALITNVVTLDFNNLEVIPMINIGLWIVCILTMIISFKDLKKTINQ